MNMIDKAEARTIKLYTADVNPILKTTGLILIAMIAIVVVWEISPFVVLYCAIRPKKAESIVVKAISPYIHLRNSNVTPVVKGVVKTTVFVFCIPMCVRLLPLILFCALLRGIICSDDGDDWFWLYYYLHIW